jgi:hypothetical protein
MSQLVDEGVKSFVKSLRGATMVQESPIKSHKSKKTPKLCESCRNHPAFNGFNLHFIHLNSLCSHNISKKSNSIGAKGALLKVSK